MKRLLTIKTTKPNKEMETFLGKTKIELDNFFGFKAKEPIIIFLNSREQMDLIWGQKTQEWQTGGTRTLNNTKNGIIFILAPNVYTKISSHKNKADFWKTLKHEYSHIYFRQITNGSYPLWLNEGLACYLAEQKKTCNNPLDVFSFFNKADNNIYGIGYFWTKLLIEKFGKVKLLKLIKELETKSNLTEKIFNAKFFRIYGFSFSKNNLTKLIK
ncbi:MAG: hypothetical protein WCP18_02025 [bacterium]